MDDEIFDVVDENGEPTGRMAARGVVHALGLWHRTAHVWIWRRRGDSVEILLQKRSQEKDAYPGCYDISSAGHVVAGDGFAESALRELREELGLSAAAGELVPCGVRRNVFHGAFHGKAFHDCEVQMVYALERDVEPEELRLQAEEVESVRWMELEACLRAVRGGGLCTVCMRMRLRW